MSTFLKQHIIGIFALLLCFGQTVACVLQAHHGQSLFNLSGTTSGKVELAMCIAMCMPIVLFEFLNPKRDNNNLAGYIYRALSFVGLFLSAVLLALSESRTSWLASILGCCYIVHNELAKRRLTIKLWQKYVAIALFIVGSIGMYHLKTNSANGRFLIWKITTEELIHNNISLLPRQGNFSTFFGDAQECYFSKAERPIAEQMLAGAPKYTYNEYLQFFVEWGLLATIVLICLATYVCKKLFHSKTVYKIPIFGSLLSIAVISAFSYPLRCTTSLFVVLCIITITIGLTIKRACIKYCLLIVFISSFVCYFTWRYRHDLLIEKALNQCRQIDLMCTYDDPAKYLQCYERLNHILDREPEFMLAYAKALYGSRNYKPAIMCLHKAQYISGDPVLYLVEGKCRQKQKLYSKAAELYKKAYYRIPHKIYPLYLLMNLYLEQRNFYNANRTALKIIRTHPKIISPEFGFIQKEAKKITNKIYSSKQ